MDSGRASGWAIVQRGADPLLPEVDALESGECSLHTVEPQRVVDMARESNCEALIMEQPGLGGTMTPIVTYGLGKPAGVWEWLWRTSKGPAARAVIVEIPGMTWRSTVIGGPQRPTAEWKADAQRMMRDHYPHLAVGAELADALCLAEHAVRSLDVADAVGVRRLAQLGWTEPRGCWADGRFMPA